MQVAIHHTNGTLLFTAAAPSLAAALTAVVETRIAGRPYTADGELLGYMYHLTPGRGDPYETVHLCHADLRGADLRGVDLSDASLHGADLRGADLRCARLRATFLYGADLRGADLRGADLFAAFLVNANAPYTRANITDARLAGCVPNWDSHLLLSELLRQAAGADLDRRRAVDALIPVLAHSHSRDEVDWLAWEQTDHPLRAWALDVLAGYVPARASWQTPRLMEQQRPRSSGDG